MYDLAILRLTGVIMSLILGIPPLVELIVEIFGDHSHGGPIAAAARLAELLAIPV